MEKNEEKKEKEEKWKKNEKKKWKKHGKKVRETRKRAWNLIARTHGFNITNISYYYNSKKNAGKSAHAYAITSGRTTAHHHCKCGIVRAHILLSSWLT